MKNATLCDACFLLFALVMVPAQLFAQARSPEPRYVDSAPKSGSAAVIIDDLPLIHTAQFVAQAPLGEGAAAIDAGKQVEQVMQQLAATLAAADSGLPRVVKVNLYVALEGDVPKVRARVATHFPASKQPAMSLIVTPLQSNRQLVAIDAVAIGDANYSVEAKRMAFASYMPAGSRLYVSGQAERGDSFREATQKTLASLSFTLRHCGRSDADIVQLKCFLPMNQSAEAMAVIGAYYGERTPAVTLVEWRSQTPPIEIECVAYGGVANRAAPTALEFLSPPGLAPSPVFSRVARIYRGGTVYLGDLPSGEAGALDEQVRVPFDALKTLLDRTGSDMRHLAKATYYVADDEISKALNGIRPKYYDPARPPAASKALIQSTGHPGARFVMDMIAVPRGE
jgi:enamine deaminase RidA (YjgF/YER057c/UK114 family)